MQSPHPTARALELDRLYQQRRGHAPQISISDDSHHVTEAIGDMYGDYGDPAGSPEQRRNSRPLSFVASPQHEQFEYIGSYFGGTAGVRGGQGQAQGQGQVGARQQPAGRAGSNERVSPGTVSGSVNGRANGAVSPKMLGPMSPSYGHENGNGHVSPPRLNRTASDSTATQPFPLNDIDYESSPAAVAQELSNLQAIRRMSMDVNASDPDLPAFGTSIHVPTVAPSHEDDEDDASRLFWVPARLHPELAPTEFKTFIEDRVERMRRRSEDNNLSPESIQRKGSGGGLRRKKSMLSRQIDGSQGYRDGAERLERKKSHGSQGSLSVPTVQNLQELESLVQDPSSLVGRLSLDTARRSLDTDGEVPAEKDMPILPATPVGQTLKRSTRTTYRRGSLRKGERVPFSKRAAARHAETDTEQSPVTSPTKTSAPEGFGLSRVQTEPIPPTPPLPSHVENFSRPARKPVSPRPELPPARSPSPPQPLTRTETAPPHFEVELRKSPPGKSFHSRIASNGRSTTMIPGYNVPEIIETPPPPEPQQPQPPPHIQHPARTSSRQTPPPQLYEPPQQPLPQRPMPAPRTSSRPPMLRQTASERLLNQAAASQTQTLEDLTAHPSPLPGNSTRSDSLSFIPTFPEDKKPEKKKSGEKKDGGDGSRKGSWSWFSSGDDKEKEKEREKERERKEKDEKEAAKKNKNKANNKPDQKDNTRLDVLQTSIDGGRGRESLVLNREDVRLDEARRETVTRKSSEDKRSKEKDSGLFSSLFGGGKKKSEKEGSSKKTSIRGLSPDPTPRVLRPDIDYNWTRFSILEERAIYRIAHIKLANPKRALYSQVLLSNFMYSYLAKVQQMHPQIQIPQSAVQKSQQRQMQQIQQKDRERERVEQREKEQREREEFEKYQRMLDAQTPSNPSNQQAGPSPSNPQQIAPGGLIHNARNAPKSPEPDHHQQSHPSYSDPRPDSRGSQHSYNSHMSNGSAGGYSVASGQSYLGGQGQGQAQGQGRGAGYYGGQGGQSVFEDDDESDGSERGLGRERW